MKRNTVFKKNMEMSVAGYTEKQYEIPSCPSF